MSSQQMIYPTGELQLQNKPNTRTIITEFQSGHGFTQNGAASSNNFNDTSDYVLGTQAASTSSDGAGGINRFTNTSLTAFNATNRCIAVYIKLDNVAHLSASQGLRIYLFSGSNANNYNYWFVQLGGDSNPICQEGVWAYLTLNFGDVAGSGGTFDKTNITGMQFNFADDNTGNHVTLHTNGVWLVPDGSDLFPSGVVSITFDDGWRQQYEVAKPILDTAGLTATAFPIVSLLNSNSKYMTDSQLQNLRDFSGWEIAAHAFTDTDHATGFGNMTNGLLAQDLQGIKYWLYQNGHTGVHNVAYPLGSYTSATIAVVRKYFRSARSIFGRTNETIYPAHPYRLRSQTGIGELSTTTPTSINSMVTKAVANHQWLILTFHKIIPTATSLTMSGTTATVVFPQAIPWSVGDSVTLAGWTPSGINGTYTISTISGDAKTVTFTIPSAPSNATVIGTILKDTAECSQAGLQSIVNQILSSGIAVRTIDEVMRHFPYPTKSSQFYRVPVADTNYTATSTDRVIAYTSLTSARTVTLPTAVAPNANMLVSIKDESGSCSSTNTITIGTSGGQTIDGASTYVLSRAYDQVTLVSNGANWDILNPSTSGTIVATLASTAATTQSVSDNSTKLATTAYVDRMGPVGVGAIGFKDDFITFTGSGNISTSAAFQCDTPWLAVQVSAGTQSASQTTDATFANPGNIKFTTTSTSGQGVALFKGNVAGGSGVLGALGSNAGWELHVIVKLGQTTNCCLRIGAAKSGQAASDAPTDGIYFEYDTANTSNSDTKFTGVIRSSSTSSYINTHSINADTNFHHFRIRSTSAGTVGFTVDGGTEDTLNSNVTTSALTPFFQLITRTAGTANATIDYFSYIASTGRV